jgi:hypothetical protein
MKGERRKRRIKKKKLKYWSTGCSESEIKKEKRT